MDFDLESLVNVEQTFYDSGYQDGFEHGRIHGLIEGRALGREKGFEMWEELGFYEGFAKTWRAVYVKQGKDDSRALNHIRHLLDLISQFPKENPFCIGFLIALCSTLGVSPSLRAADSADDSVEQSAARKPSVWPLETPKQQDLSF
ncbi:hypothetical protein IW261DRAFT_1551401 [Armillaria novae-zelandiae]|uniref:Essential protein Yae1 N-terminal domain-containing protein n=1 Tax=Armillaria novae-zelandiae TaxID=153914 RepID=A0AA39UAV4_9AGAR|nr:hypothetical protein IW261DRAFT_1551401 [Armillaria novae-zelandiae]